MLRVINTAWLVSSQGEAGAEPGIAAVGLMSMPMPRTTFVRCDTMGSPRIAVPSANLFAAEPREFKKKCINFKIWLSVASNTATVARIWLMTRLRRAP